MISGFRLMFSQFCSRTKSRQGAVLLSRARSGRVVATVLAELLLSSCAGSSLSKIDHAQDLPEDVPKEYHQKFKVQDAMPAAPTEAPRSAVSPEEAVSEAAPVKPKKRHRVKKRSPEQLAVDAEMAKIGPPAHIPLVYRNLRRGEMAGKEPIWIGEKLTYEVTYLGLSAATLTLEVLPFKFIDGRKVYHVQATARTSNVFNLVYKLEDTVQTFIDYESVFSHRFHMQLDETKQIRDSLELYDSEYGQAFWWNRWNRREKGYEEKKEYHPMDAFPQDSLSVLYYLRFVPMPTGGEIKFNVESEAKPLDMVVTVEKREDLETPMGVLRAIKLKPEAATRGVLERKGNSYLWLTDDDRRMLIRLEAKVKIGTVVVALKKMELGSMPTPSQATAPSETPRQ